MGSAPYSANLEVENTSVLLALSGPQSRLLGAVARASGADVNLRGNTILLAGQEDDVRVAHRFLSGAATLVEKGVDIGPNDVASQIALSDYYWRSRRQCQAHTENFRQPLHTSHLPASFGVARNGPTPWLPAARGRPSISSVTLPMLAA